MKVCIFKGYYVLVGGLMLIFNVWFIYDFFIVLNFDLGSLNYLLNFRW